MINQNMHYKRRRLLDLRQLQDHPDNFAVFARYDKYQPDSTNSLKDMSIVIAGVDWIPVHSSWKIQRTSGSTTTLMPQRRATSSST